MNFRGGSTHRKMHLAPSAPPPNAVLAGLRLAIARELDPGTVHQQVQLPNGTAIRDLDGHCFLSTAQRRELRNGPVQTSPFLQRWTRTPFIEDRWAPSTSRPLSGASQVMSLSNQIRSEPGFLSALL